MTASGLSRTACSYAAWTDSGVPWVAICLTFQPSCPAAAVVKSARSLQDWTPQRMKSICLPPGILWPTGVRTGMSAGRAEYVLRAARAAVRPGESAAAAACELPVAGVVSLPHADRASRAVTGMVAVRARRAARPGLELIVEYSRGV